MVKQFIADFRKKAFTDNLLSSDTHLQELVGLYPRILRELLRDYDTYRHHIASFLDVLEQIGITAISLSGDTFFEIYPEIVAIKNTKKPDTAFMQREPDDAAFQKLKDALQVTLAADNQVRIHNFNPNISSLTVAEAESIASVYVHLLQDGSKKMVWSLEEVNDWSLNLAVLRKTLLLSNNIESFYHAVGIFLDRLASSEHYQLGRDVCEEFLMASFLDGVPELGFFCCFRFYSISKNAQAALMYANLTLYATRDRSAMGAISTRFIRELVWQSLKMFRGLGLALFAVKVYEERPPLVYESDYERHSLDHTYFTVLLSYKAAELPYKIYDYLNQERESIFDGGPHEAMPWLTTLYQIRRLYSEKPEQLQLLDQYISILEHIAPAEMKQWVKSIVEGDRQNLRKYLLTSLQQLHRTRSIDDFVYDNDQALTFSGRLLPTSVAEQDASSFLLAMVVRSDFSVLFQSTTAEDAAPILPQQQAADEPVYRRYVEEAGLPSIFAITPQEEVTWLALVEGALYQLNLADEKFSFYKPASWENALYRHSLHQELFAGLGFDTTVKERRGGVRQVLPEEHEQAEQKLVAELSYATLNINPYKRTLLIVKDMELANYPHNLFLGLDGQFIHRERAITNIVSSEWFAANAGKQKLAANYSKSIWIPVASGDFALSTLYSKIEDALSAHAFSVSEEIELAEPLRADLNIVCSHGARNISETQIVSQTLLPEDFEQATEHFTFNLDNVVGKGKVLVFFVCHSGSMRSEFFKNSISSLVKRYLRKGYSAVIAPAWALHVYVPGIWLPVFLQNLQNGHNISTSMFNANMAVREVYPTPAAWACLHLYGDPHIMLETQATS
ncbi:hypothetical protein GCM10022408_29790 [Hymenobacter fastidiosus]|uniref:CHAT domain-containing protein n=1 Tax=Hymenobacter fastidiosus TaxID=486264 RepID=A0ABP7SPE4_9BACT